MLDARTAAGTPVVKRRPTHRGAHANRSTLTMLASLLLAAVLAGCEVGGDRQADMVQLQMFLMKPRRPMAGIEYRVYPPDVLQINSVNVTEINGVAQQIRPDGKINVPLLGEITVAGHTAAEIETILQETATRYYRKTDAKVVVQQYNSQKYYVMGQVAKPGSRTWTGRNTVLDALTDALPLDETSWPEKVRILRSRKPATGGYLPEMPVKGESPDAMMMNPRGNLELTVDLMAMIRSGDMSHNILLMPDDVVYVPPTPWAAAGLEFRRIIYPFTPVTEGVQTYLTLKDAYNNNASTGTTIVSSGK